MALFPLFRISPKKAVLSGFNFATQPFNIVTVGDSLVAGVGGSNASKAWPAVLQTLAPVNNRYPIINQGVGGSSIANMITNQASQVDANYKTGFTNILFAMEGTNSVCNQPITTGLESARQMAVYCQNVLAVHSDWRIILVKTIPRGGIIDYAWSTFQQVDAELRAYNTYLAQNYRAMGAQSVLDMRAGGVFTCNPNTGVLSDACLANMVADKVHCNDAGYVLLANYAAQALNILPAAFLPKTGTLGSTVSLTQPVFATLTGPSSGAVGAASSAFSSSLLPVGAANPLSPLAITPNSANAGTFTPVSFSFTDASVAKTFTFRPTSAGTGAIGLTTPSGIKNPSSINYTAS